MTQVSSVAEQQAAAQRERADTLAQLESLAGGLRASITTFTTGTGS
jgi:nicotinamide mononucleotide (NMN) deamidase PncC